MIQHYFTSGTTLIVANLELFNKFNTEQVMQDEIRILVDTSVARTVVLPRITEFPVRNVRITVVDITGSASGNNITVTASTGSPNDAINGSPTYTISANFGANRFEPLDNNDWFVINVGSGGGAPLVVSMTYAQLTAAIGSSSLITGQSILLTDYQTVYYLQYSGDAPSGIGNEQVNTGAIEPLLLKATSSNTLSDFAESLTYPQDTIIYLPVMPDKNYDYCAAQGKGCIIFRRDNQQDVSRDYDWRTILFRRWETVAGNGNYWSYKPVTGAAFQDSLGFGANVQVVYSVNVKSLLSFGALYASTPYWLDNTIFNNEIVASVLMGGAFGNTFTYFNDTGGIFAAFESNACYQNTIVQNNCYLNSFADFVGNSIIQTSNNQNGIQRNSIGGCFGNTLEELVSNHMGTMDENAGVSIILNNTNRIALNSCERIEGNSVGDIVSNVCNLVTNNVGAQIVSNTCAEITNNMVNQIVLNNNVLQVIDGNICDSIKSNTTPTEISGNIGTAIEDCSNTGVITNNNFAENISDISGTGDVVSNLGIRFSQIILLGNFTYNNNVNFDTVSASDAIGNTTFNGQISSKAITPTANMINGLSAIVKYDFGLAEFVEEILTSGVLTYSPPITS